MDFASLVGVVAILCENLFQRSSRTRSLSRDIADLRSSTAELKAVRDDLRKQIKQDEAKGRACTHHAREWLCAVEAAETRATSLLEEYARRRQRRPYLTCLRPCSCAHHTLSDKVSALQKHTAELIERAGDIKTDGGVNHDLCKEIPIRPAIGRSEMMEQIWEFLADEETGIIGVYGPGGVGKTTLLQHVNNELISKLHEYDVVIWVTLSGEDVSGSIQRAVGARLGLSWGERESREQRALRIYSAMKQKQFLLLLDDVWEQIDLENIGIPRPDNINKSKAIFTTRSMAICSAMGAHRRLKIEYLQNEHSWQLFCDKMGKKDLIESRLIRPLAETIVSKCGGLPLALITLARTMAHRETEEEWIHAAQALNRSPAEVQGMEDVFSLLKFSYDNLDSNLLRACFLYCALFPEEHCIEIEQLVEYWLGEEFLTASHGINTVYKGYALIGDLKAACLLESGDERTQVKMHNIIRSFALWISCKQGTDNELILVYPRTGLTKAPESDNWRRALVISLMDNRIEILPDIPVCPNLTTLMLQQNRQLKKIPLGFFTHMPVLRVLDLSFTDLTEIPSSIEYLIELCHLALSGTKISALPVELGNLEKLKHLDLQRTQFLQTIPRDAIYKLRKLEVLNLYYSYAGWEILTDEEELTFSHLEHLNNLASLGLTVLLLESLQKLREFSALHDHLQYLHIEECRDLFRLDLSSSFGGRLRRLSVKSCDELEYLIVTASPEKEWLLPCLEVLTLHSLHSMTRVWKNPVTQESLGNVRSINISCCHKLKCLSWLLQLPKLEVIDLNDCRELEELITEEEGYSVEDSTWLPSLKTLSMRNLPELRSILPFQFSFPNLETIAIVDCHKVKKLPFLAKKQRKLTKVYCEKTWWDALEREEHSIELSGLPQFEQI